MRLRNLAPWRRFEIDTCWSPEVAAIELKKSVDPGSMFGGGGGGSAPFIGDVGDDSVFRFRRRIGYRNSFLPIVSVVVEPAHRGGARLRVSMRLHAFVAVFMAVWMTFAAIGAFAGMASVVAGHAAGLIGLALPLFGVGLATTSFALEADKAEHLLRSIYVRAPALPLLETGKPYR